MIPSFSAFVRSFRFVSLALVLSACGSKSEDGSSPGQEGLGGAGSGSGGADGAEGGAGGEESGSGGGLLTEPPAVPACPKSTVGFATEVIEHEFGTDQDFGQEEFPDPVLGGPQGSGCCGGGLDVTSLGDGGTVVLGFGDRAIVDGPGVDFIVSENAFWAGGNEEKVVAELALVSVSEDGETWVDFPCDPGEEPPFGDCAGYRPVLANVLDPSTDPFDPQIAGGDQYDLEEVGLKEARYVRITDLKGDEAVFDLDAVTVVNGRCE